MATSEGFDNPKARGQVPQFQQVRALTEGFGKEFIFENHARRAAALDSGRPASELGGGEGTAEESPPGGSLTAIRQLRFDGTSTSE